MHSTAASVVARAWRAMTQALAAAVLIGLSSGGAVAQTPELPHLDDVKKLPGVPVAQAVTPGPETLLGLTGYRITRVVLPQPSVVGIEGKRTEVSEGWHVTVSFAKPLAVRNQAFSLVIDGRWCGFLAESPDLMSADTVCFDPRAIREGAALGVTYRSIEIAPSPESVRLLSPDVQFTDEDTDAVHYSSARLQLLEVR